MNHRTFIKYLSVLFVLLVLLVGCEHKTTYLGKEKIADIKIESGYGWRRVFYFDGGRVLVFHLHEYEDLNIGQEVDVWETKRFDGTNMKPLGKTYYKLK